MMLLSYWVWPIIAGLVWLGMLLGLLLHCMFCAASLDSQVTLTLGDMLADFHLSP